MKFFRTDYLIKIVSPTVFKPLDLAKMDDALRINVIDISANKNLGTYRLKEAKIKFFGDISIDDLNAMIPDKMKKIKILEKKKRKRSKVNGVQSGERTI